MGNYWSEEEKEVPDLEAQTIVRYHMTKWQKRARDRRNVRQEVASILAQQVIGDVMSKFLATT